MAVQEAYRRVRSLFFLLPAIPRPAHSLRSGPVCAVCASLADGLYPALGTIACRQSLERFDRSLLIFPLYQFCWVLSTFSS